MVRPVVALSKVADGTMYIPGDTTNTAVVENRRAWLQPLGVSLDATSRVAITYDQPDFRRYRTVTSKDKGDGMYDDSKAPADALVVTQPGHALFLPVADCVATVFFDEAHSVMMLSHLGRHSLEQRGGIASVHYLTEHFGTDPTTLKVWLSPAPGKQVYPIFALGNKGMKEVLYEQLAEAGITAKNITDNSADTATDPEYYSHSQFLAGNKPEDGRFGMVAMMEEV